MTDTTPTRPEAEKTNALCECGKKLPRCDTTELCLTCMRKLNPKEFKETIIDILDTWVSNRPDIEVEELRSLCPAIGSMIRLRSRNKPAPEGESAEQS